MSRWRVLSQVVLVAVQVARVMSSYCEARLWQFCHVVVPWGGACPVMDGRFLLELVSSPKYKPTLAPIFFILVVCSYKGVSGHPLGTALRACRRMPTTIRTFAHYVLGTETSQKYATMSGVSFA